MSTTPKTTASATTLPPKGGGAGQREDEPHGDLMAKALERIAEKGFDGMIGMEFGNSQPGRDGEQAVIATMRAIDPAAPAQ